jgi:hypothetical protein
MTARGKADIPRCLSDAQRRPFRSRLATCAIPRGLDPTRHEAKRGLRASAILKEKRPRRGRALCTQKSNGAPAVSDLLEIGALGSRLKSSGGRGPATGKSGHLTLGNHSPMVFGRPFGVVSAPRKTEITNARCNSGVGNYPRIGFGLPGHASGSPA